jgi:hypothetical protein
VFERQEEQKPQIRSCDMTDDGSAESEDQVEALDNLQRFELAYGTVENILNEMGINDVGLDSVIVASSSDVGPALLEDRAEFNRFIVQFSLKIGCVGYAVDDVASLTVEEFCWLYVGDSYPAVPTVPLSSQQYALNYKANERAGATTVQEFPICFVLGCPRSGTTLFRTMLNVHDEIWAPGELHLAKFETMSDRAEEMNAYVRNSVIPEVAARLGTTKEAFSRDLENWEQENLRVSEVYQKLYTADPDRLIIDKSPSYSGHLQFLKRIDDQFENAKYIFLIRNPHDVIRSYVKIQLHKGDMDLFEKGLNPYQMAEIIWFVHNQNIASFLTDIPSERKCIVRYEDLVSDPETQLRNVCSMLNLDYDMNMVDPYRNRRGRVAMGAGDMHVNFFERVENRKPIKAFYRMGPKCQSLAGEYGY